MNCKLLLLLSLLLWTACRCEAQEAPKRELRGVWIATVGNIDWPSKQGLSSTQQRAEFINHLELLSSLGFNTVIVQVRPAADAFYESSYEPWSRYLSGKQGVAPFPAYDPLAFMIEECHKRNMDIHAWFNPYRALVSSASNPNPSNHVTKTHPHWLIHYGGKAYFDPGNPQAREYIIKVMLEAVKKYDFDALHIDDYFYPYPIAGKEFGDHATYAQYGNGMSKADWRRQNVNTFIQQLHHNIKSIKPYMKFGVSPFGIWRNQKQDPEGSLTNGSSCYDELYSDVRLWVKNKWLDYVAPQLYWERGHKAACYNKLLPWWSDNKYERDLYIGLGLYRMVDAKIPQWQSPRELLEQIKMSRNSNASGVIFYSMSNFYKIGHAIRDSLRDFRYFGHVSIPPANTWIKSDKIDAPKVEFLVQGNNILIKWNKIAHPYGNVKYLVYQFAAGENKDYSKAKNVAIITSDKQIIIPKNQISGHQIVVTAVDRLWNESVPSNIILIP